MRVNIGKYPKSDTPRKISVKIDEWDTWSMDHTLALIIHPMLLQLKEQKHGSPMVDDEDVPEHLRSTAAPPKENEWDTDLYHHDRWDYVLDEMIFAFEFTVTDDADSEFYKDLGEAEFVEREDGHHELVWTREPVVDHDGLKRFYNRVDNGYRLFGKYYRALWT